MSSHLGNKIKVQIFGQSHSKGLGVVIDGLPAGERIDLDEVNRFLQRRAGGKNRYSTKRSEKDMPEILSGLVNDITCGAPLCAVFENANTKSGDYKDIEDIPRPSHADFTAFIKHNGFNDKSGGGHFSGRLTLPLCFAGAVCKQILSRRGITVGAHIYSIANIEDKPFDPVGIIPKDISFDGFPVVDKAVGDRMVEFMEKTAEEGDSVGGVVECAVLGLPIGIGEPMFENIESKLSYGIFGIPAVKGVEFGAGFAASKMMGSEFNDSYTAKNGEIKTETNNSGGVLGGISNGMPVIFRVAFKPTPSIYKEQKSVNLKTMEDVNFRINGRHDPCIVPRAVPVVEAVAAIVICDIYSLRCEFAKGKTR